MPSVDVAFRVTGAEIPADHGFALFAAISRVLPTVHGDETIGIHPIPGRLIGGRMLALTDRSRLTIRLDSDRVPEALPLAGKQLDIAGSAVRVGVPNIRALIPAARLRSRLVVIKGFLDAEPFLAAVRRQMEEIGVEGAANLVERRRPTSLEGGVGSRSDAAPYVRRTLRIRGKTIVGYAVELSDLNAEESLNLQETGLGGRRRFGCGVFVAVR